MEESVGVLEVMVERDQGLVGEVSVVYFVTDEGATNGEDFVVDSLNVRRGGRERGGVKGRGRGEGMKKGGELGIGLAVPVRLYSDQI